MLLTAPIDTVIAGQPWLVMADTQSVSRRYIVVPDSIIQEDSALLPPTAVSDAPGTSTENLRSAAQGADDLIIFFDDFQQAADSLAAWRAQHLPLIATPAPHVARAIPISALFDQFSGGRTDPGAIRNFLRAAAGWSRRPLYVTFLGDASFDYKNITGRAAPGQPGCLLPTFENNFDAEPVIRRQYSTDDWLVNVNDPVNVLPDYLVGRIPAADVTSALSVVTEKLLAYERRAPFGEYRNSLIFMADDDVQGNDFDPLCWTHVLQTASLDEQSTPEHMDRQYVYLHTFDEGPGGGTRPGARVQLFKDLNAGATMFNYIGHGSPFKMSDEGVFLDTDAGTLTNGLKMSLLVAASCDVGKFNDPSVQSLGERIFVSPGAGCIGVISATEQALSNLNSFLNGKIYEALFDRDTITVGGAFLPSVGQYHVPTSAALVSAKYFPGQGANSQKYQLMGDPATQLNLPRLWADLELTDALGAPISTLARPLPSADLLTGAPVEKAHYERSDISVVPAAGVVGEAMVMLTLADFVLDKFGGDSLPETRGNLDRYRERISRSSGNTDTRRLSATEVDAPEGAAGAFGSGGDD